MSTFSVYKATGIILSRRNVGEADRIITILCRHIGKKRVIAKGVRKIGSRRASHLEPFTKVTLMLHRGKSLDVVTEASTIVNYGRSFETLRNMAAGYLALETVAKILPEAGEHDEVLELLDRYLSDVRTLEEQNIKTRLITFIDTILRILGYRKRETTSRNLIQAISSVENIIERKLRSAKLLSRSGIV
jgi:DNA repair protein RecO (recombination protein O)